MFKKNWNIFFTPYHQNDDVYFIYASLYNNCNFISNDNLVDHQFIMCFDDSKNYNNINNQLKYFILNNRITYKLNKNKLHQINYPKCYSNNIQNTKKWKLKIINYNDKFKCKIEKVSFWHLPFENKCICYKI